VNGKAPTTDDVAAKADSKGTKRGPSVDQLLRQCQTAAGRGDCAAAKVIAAQIAKTDAEFYRTRVTKDAAISRCLAK
jgi:hypothetical protein